MLAKLPFILLSLAIVALAAISLVPGGEGAYASLPMVCLWGAIAIFATIYIFRRKLYRRAAVFTLHIAFLVILAGAAITWFSGSSTTLHLRVGQPAEIGGHRVELTRFAVEYYPGTQAPADFVSTLLIDGREARVSMNRTHTAGAYRIFQTAYDPDRQGSILTVASDRAGTAVSYAGYALLAVAMLWCLIERRKSRSAAVALLALTAFGASAAPRTIPAHVADEMGRLYVYRGGRIMPLSTLAHDFSLKVAGSTSPAGVTAEQFLSGWLFFYDDWKTVPCIKVKGEGRLALTDFFAPGGAYRFDGPGHTDANEKFSLISEAVAGSLWRIFPQHHSAEGYEWLSPVDSPQGDIDVDEWHFIRHGLNYLAELASDGRWDEFNTAIQKIEMYQYAKAHEVLPGPWPVRCERAFVRLSSWPWAAALLLLGGLLSFFFFSPVWARAVAGAGALWVGILIALSWIASGAVPLTDGSQTMLCLALVALVTGLWVGRRNARIVPLAAIVGALALAVALLGSRQPQITQAVPVLRSPLLSVHVLAVTCAYALLALMAMCGAAWLLGRRELLAIGHRLIEPAVFLLAAGIFIGAVWANMSWGRYWGWDPKETWALITMLVYSLPLHRASLPALARDRVFAWYSLVAFVTVLVTYFGVNFFMSGLHSYA